MAELWAGVEWALGLEAETLSLAQMALRAILTFLVGLTIVRIGEGDFWARARPSTSS